MQNQDNSGKNYYHTIAPYYNLIMSHVDYTQWATHLRRLLKSLHSNPQTILELGAGTAPFLEENLFPNGSLVVQSDISIEMLGQGLTRAPTNRHRTLFAVCDASLLPFQSKFDLCLMVYDALNYLPDTAALYQTFREVSRILSPGGHFIFDVTTEYNSKSYFLDSVEYEEEADCAIIRQSWFVESKKHQLNKFTFFLEESDGRFSKKTETHIQCIFDHNTLCSAGEKCGLSFTGCWDNFTLNPVQKNSERIHYAFSKPK